MLLIPHREKPLRIGIFTGGGVAPGLNAVIAGATNVLRDLGHKVVGIQEGWAGLLEKKKLIDLSGISRHRINSLIKRGGSILKNSRKKIRPEDYEKVENTAHQYRLDGVIAVGGDDTLGQAAELYKADILNIIGVPKTIDNDVHGTEMTFGFQTAYNEAARHIERMRMDAQTMCRVAIVEIMGRDAGWITLYAGHYGNADITLIPEFPISDEELCPRIQKIYDEQKSVVIALAEGYTQTTGEADDFGHERKEDAGKNLATIIKEKTGLATQVLVPGYDIRNGPPVAADAIFAAKLGATAGLLAHEEEFGRMVSWRDGQYIDVPLDEARGGRRVTEEYYDVDSMRKYDLPPNIVREILKKQSGAGGGT